MDSFAEEELFLRDLSEVHLLIDFVSGRSGKSLDQLGGKIQFNASGVREDGAVGGSGMPAQRVVEDICRISYPPQGSLDNKAEQAAFIMVVKDKLNDLAWPARGLTVAFTAMFAGVALEPRTFWQGLADRLDPNRKTVAQKTREAAIDGSARNRQPSSRKMDSFYSALAAFPNLESQARRLRKLYNRLPWSALGLVVLIAYCSWDTSVTGALLRQLTTAESDYSALFGPDRRFAPTPEHCANYPPAPMRAAGAAPANPAGTTTAPSDADDHEETTARETCDQARGLLEDQMAGRLTLQNLMSEHPLLHPVAMGVWLFSQDSRLLSPSGSRQPPVSGSGGHTSDGALATPNAGRNLRRNAVEEVTIAVVAGFNTVIIPTLFGWLGTLVGVGRSMTSKMRDSLLAPRDWQITRISILLGMSAGLTVGLFFNPSDATGAIAKGLGGAISVSAASLSFLAGLGAEAFFTFLDGLITGVFPQHPPSQPAKQG